MKEFVGATGFLFVSGVVYVVVSLALIMWHPLFLAEHFPIAVQGTNNPIGLLVAVFAGVSSFRASTRNADEETKEYRIVSRVGTAVVILIMIAVVVSVVRL